MGDLTRTQVVTNIKLRNASRNVVTLVAPGTLTPFTFTFPIAAGTDGYFLGTNGSGTTSWNNTVKDTFKINSAGDATKQIAFSAANVTAGQTRTITAPNWSLDLANLSREIYITGFEAWSDSGDYYSITSTTNFNVLRGGTGYVRSRPVTWVAQTATLTANECTYVYIDSAGTIGTTLSVTQATYQDYIFLFQVLYDGTNYLVKNEQHPYNFQSTISGFFHNNLGTIIRGIGGVIAKSGTNNVSIDADYYEDHGLTTTISASSAITIEFFYTNASGKWIRYSQTTTVPLVRNNAGTVTVLTGANNYVVYRMYVTSGASPTVLNSPTYIALIQTAAAYTTLANAQSAITNGNVVSPTNELARMELCQLGYLIVNGAATSTIQSVTVQKNTFNAKYIGGQATGSSHLLLTDLLGGQYTDGGHTTLAMTKETTAAPTATDDIAAYKDATIWIDTSATPRGLYTCLDNTSTAAVWFNHRAPALTSVTVNGKAAIQSMTLSVTTKTGDATLDDTYNVYRCEPADSTTITLTLPASGAHTGIRYTFIKTNATTGLAVIARAGADTIDVALTSYTLTNQGDRVVMLDTGVGWFTGV